MERREETSKELVKTLIVVAACLGGIVVGWFFLQQLTGTPFPLLVVKSESMTPTIMKGDIIAITSVDYSEIRAEYGTGDVLIFYRPGYLGDDDWIIVHRAVRRLSSGVITKGDHNLDTDEFTWGPVPEENIIGKWTEFSIPYWAGIGYLVLVLRGEELAPLGTAIIATVIVVNVIIIARDLLRARDRVMDESEASNERSTHT